MLYSHKPIMEQEISQLILRDPDGFYLDATVGLGGHASKIAGFLKAGKLLGLDQDSEALLYAEEGRVSIFLFQDAKSYHLVTGRPEWSGGASAVSERKLYVYKSRELTGILAHELCHIYYDGFYIGGHPDPLWLSEGMATMIQVERGFARPQWLRDNLKVIEEGGGYSLKDLMAVTTMGNAPTSEIQLWYTESYSLVHYLFREHYPSMFYRFSKYIRNGYPVRESLYQAYGMPFNKISSLEYAWRTL